MLQVARSNVSTSLRELQNWNLVQVVHLAGDRRDHFETAQDPWELLRIIVRERKEREFDPTVAFLRGCVERPGVRTRGRGHAQAPARDAVAHGGAVVLDRRDAAARHAHADAPHADGRQGARAAAAVEDRAGPTVMT